MECEKCTFLSCVSKTIKKGFFVEELLVVECTSVDDMIAVLHEGMKNRRVGSHDLNKDSSRSHSILTLYVISEVIF